MTNILNININRIVDPFFEQLSWIEKEQVQQIATAVLPLFSLHATAALVSNIALTGYQFTTICWFQGAEEWRRLKNLEFSEPLFRLACSVTSLSLSIFFPLFGIGFSFVLKIGESLFHLKNEKNGQALVKLLFDLVHQSAYTGSVIYVTSELVVLSRLLQAIKEIYQATQFSKVPRSLAECVQFILACARLWQARIHADRAYLKHFGKEISQQQWDEEIVPLLEKKLEIEVGEKPKIEEIFREKRFSLCIKDVAIVNYHLEEMSFEYLSFEGCDFQGTYWRSCVFEAVSFTGCNLSSQPFVSCLFKNTLFLDSDLSSAIFNDSSFFNSSIRSCRLERASFFHASSVGSTLQNCDLTDVLLFLKGGFFRREGCTENILTKPVIAFPLALADELTFAPLIQKSLEDNGALCLMIDHSHCPGVDASLLRQEVVQGLKKIEEDRPQEMLSLPDELLSRAEEGSQVWRVQQMAQEAMQYADGLILPGGSSMEREWYGRVTPPEDYTEDAIETCMTFALLQQAHRTGTPSMGVCLGAQKINVFLGGTLRGVKGQWGEMQAMHATNSAVSLQVQEFIGLGESDPLIGYSCHEQAADAVAPSLQVVFDFNGIPKLMVSTSGTPFIASQMHPEIYLPILGVLSKEQKIKGVKVWHWEAEAVHWEEVAKQNQRVYQLFMETVARQRFPYELTI